MCACVCGEKRERERFGERERERQRERGIRAANALANVRGGADCMLALVSLILSTALHVT